MVGANLVCMLAVMGPALAADASPWDGGERAAVRLIQGAPRAGSDKIYRAGVEIRLAPGWKTYWRYPGDSGIPPRFDFASSQNVKTITVGFPAPQRLADDSGTSIGYKRDVIFPLEIVPRDAALPVTLVLKIDYAVCEKLCMPADGEAELTLTGAAGQLAERLAQSEAQIPKPTTIGADAALAVRNVRRETGGKLPRILVDVAAPAGVALDLFAEGPQADWALPVPSPVPGAPTGQQRFAFDLDGLPPNAKPGGAVLKLTVVAGAHAIEVPYHLD